MRALILALALFFAPLTARAATYDFTWSRIGQTPSTGDAVTCASMAYLGGAQWSYMGANETQGAAVYDLGYFGVWWFQADGRVSAGRWTSSTFTIQEEGGGGIVYWARVWYEEPQQPRDVAGYSLLRTFHYTYLATGHTSTCELRYTYATRRVTAHFAGYTQ